MKRTNYLWIFFSSIFLGIITGLSVSPVVQIVITSFLSLLIPIISIIVGVKWSEIKKKYLAPSIKESQIGEIEIKELEIKFFEVVKHIQEKLNIFPIFILLFGFVVGALSGIYIRNHDYLSKSNMEKLDEWKKITGDTSNMFVGKVMFQKLYLKNEIFDQKQTDGLYSKNISDTTEIDELIQCNEDELKKRLRISKDPILIELGNSNIDTKEIAEIIKRVWERKN